MAKKISDIITITAAGTAKQGPDIQGGDFLIKAHPDNAGNIWVGNDGSDDVTPSNGFPLGTGQTVVISTSNLNKLFFDADAGNDGDKVCWIRLEL